MTSVQQEQHEPTIAKLAAIEDPVKRFVRAAKISKKARDALGIYGAPDNDGGLMDERLITREADVLDRRIVRVAISPEGAAVLKRGRSRKNAYLARRLERLDDEQLRTLERAAGLIERLVEDDEERSH